MVSKLKKRKGRKPHDKNNNDGFIFNISINHPKDFTNTTLQTSIQGNIAGCLNYINAYFTFAYHNHYKPILSGKRLKYLNSISPQFLLSSQNKSIAKDNSDIRSSLIDDALIISPLPYSTNKLTEFGKEKVRQKEIEAKINLLSSLTLDELNKLIETIK